VLTELQIRNLAIVEDVVIPFDAGLNVMTGSTGAGKSIILAAVELLSGARPKRGLMREGGENLAVVGTFSVDGAWSLRPRFGMNAGETELSIRREVAADGRSRVWINGIVSTVASSQEASRALIELHGQHRQQELLDPANHILYLDAWGDYDELLGRCMERIDRLQSLTRRLQNASAKAEEHRREEDYLRFQLADLEELKLEPELDRSLESRIRRLENAQKFVSALEESQRLLGGEGGSVLEGLARAARALEAIAPIESAWGETASELREARITIQEATRRIERSLSEIDVATDDIESLQRRLANVQRACRKHGLDVNGLIGKRDEIRSILSSLDGGPIELEEMRREWNEAKRELLPMLEELSRRRGKSASALDEAVTEELHELGMGGALFATRVERIENSAFQEGQVEIHLSPRGWDRVEFGIRTNVGEAIHPLADIVSGGELSRITLVLKKLEAEGRRIPTLIFDEIDAGLGADLGVVVADRLEELAKKYQVICVTHVPQVAARAGRHIKISKQVRGGRTVASAKILEGVERVAEVARMLGGRGTLGEELAEELLRKAST
jgi:DNA repair protein RecN (Recombination protein N)